MLVDKLVHDGVFSVIERKELDKIITEQNFSNSDRADPASAAKIARILGVDGIIIGSITQFGRDDKSTTVGGGALGNVTGRFGLGGVKRTESNAVVQITARMIDTSTAEILASASGKGESTRNGVGLLGAGGSAYGAGGRTRHRHEVQQFRQHHPRRSDQQGGDGGGRASWRPGASTLPTSRGADQWPGGGCRARRQRS